MREHSGELRGRQAYSSGGCAGLSEQAESPASRFTRPTVVELGTQDAASIRRTRFDTNSFLPAHLRAVHRAMQKHREHRQRSHGYVVLICDSAWRT